MGLVTGRTSYAALERLTCTMLALTFTKSGERGKTHTATDILEVQSETFHPPQFWLSNSVAIP